MVHYVTLHYFDLDILLLLRNLMLPSVFLNVALLIRYFYVASNYLTLLLRYFNITSRYFKLQ